MTALTVPPPPARIRFQLGRLFQPFQRLDRARISSAPGLGVAAGLGLGLAIVSAIAAAHGAELRAVTRGEGGLAVEVVFPPRAGLACRAGGTRPVRHKESFRGRGTWG